MNNQSSPKKLIQKLSLAKKASLQLAQLSGSKKNKMLQHFYTLILKNKKKLLQKNALDLKNFKNHKNTALFERLKLSDDKLNAVLQGIKTLIQMKDPIGVELEKTLLDHNLVLTKKSMPLGVIGVVFESRPDVIPQILSLALKTGNCVLLKGGREAFHTNQFFMKLVSQLSQNSQASQLPWYWAQALNTREEFQEILLHPEYINLIIPRGSNALVQSIQKKSKIPVLGHADGICHLYVHSDAALKKALPLILDSKTQYPAACNALETLLVHQKIAPHILSSLFQKAQGLGLTLKGCSRTQKILPLIQRASKNDFSKEWGALVLGVKIVSSLEEACEHIEKYGSHHTDGILTQNQKTAQKFIQNIDSANVFINASTRFADGFRYGFGAEVGISTSKLHARGPVGIQGLVSYQYILHGKGHRVAEYTGKQAKKFQHKKLKIK